MSIKASSEDVKKTYKKNKPLSKIFPNPKDNFYSDNDFYLGNIFEKQDDNQIFEKQDDDQNFFSCKNSNDKSDDLKNKQVIKKSSEVQAVTPIKKSYKQALVEENCKSNKKLDKNNSGNNIFKQDETLNNISQSIQDNNNNREIIEEHLDYSNNLMKKANDITANYNAIEKHENYYKYRMKKADVIEAPQLNSNKDSDNRSTPVSFDNRSTRALHDILLELQKNNKEIIEDESEEHLSPTDWEEIEKLSPPTPSQAVYQLISAISYYTWTLPGQIFFPASSKKEEDLQIYKDRILAIVKIDHSLLNYISIDEIQNAPSRKAVDGLLVNKNIQKIVAQRLEFAKKQ
jgi:hypothetical protein